MYAGIHRTSGVVARFNAFKPATRELSAMKKLVRNFNANIATAEKEGKLVPYTIAAKYSHKFVNVQPFVDGSGRTCWLILNAIPLKYAGIVVPLGENEANRHEYLDVTSSVSM